MLKAKFTHPHINGNENAYEEGGEQGVFFTCKSLSVSDGAV